MVSNVLEMDQDELVKLIKSFKTKYKGDPDWDEVRAGFPKSWPI
ncbi:MAG TPA: hypothetical protein VGS01_13920 [Candidatus Limnocylindria bacterium]|jgi:hypothetical protein|nr:hypothetical protein [Candidatus Limnocylindria bacterium]